MVEKRNKPSISRAFVLPVPSCPAVVTDDGESNGVPVVIIASNAMGFLAIEDMAIAPGAVALMHTLVPPLPLLQTAGFSLSLALPICVPG